MWWIRNFLLVIKYKLGIAKEGIDFIAPGYYDAVADNCPEFWTDEHI